jgi:hypothetical protein
MADTSNDRSRGWRQNKLDKQPLKFNALISAEAHLQFLENNIRIIMLAKGLTPDLLTRHLRRHKIGANRYVLKPRKGYYPRIELAELIVIAWYLKVPLADLMFKDLTKGIEDSIALTKKINSKKTADKMLRNNKLSTRDTY